MKNTTYKTFKRKDGLLVVPFELPETTAVATAAPKQKKPLTKSQRRQMATDKRNEPIIRPLTPDEKLVLHAVEVSKSPKLQREQRERIEAHMNPSVQAQMPQPTQESITGLYQRIDSEMNHNGKRQPTLEEYFSQPKK